MQEPKATPNLTTATPWKGVIHRDLKPANILVTEIDENEDLPVTTQPKILDFGVARATDADIQMTTLGTGIGQLIGTVPYMSPEQAAGEADNLDTRSDVYALGVVGYELLAGRLPYDVQRKLVHEAVRIIREDEPTPLSSVNRTFRGDLQTIIAKALQKDRERRYGSALDLASDIERYLHDEPIIARPPSTWYQFSKFARRNWALAGGIAMAIVALTGGLTATTTMYIQGESARAEAAHERDVALRRSYVADLLTVRNA